MRSGYRGPDEIIESLERRFDAALAHEDSVAATDLAASLRQAIPFVDALKGLISLDVITPRGVSLPVRVVREDHVAAGSHGEILIPLTSATFVRMPAASSGDAPTHEPGKLFNVLRGHARSASRVEVSTEARDFRGAIVAATPDYVVVKDRAREVIVAGGAIRSVRLSRGGSAGDF